MDNLKYKYKLLINWWRSLNITDDAALAEAFNGHIINFAYNSGNIENPNVTYHDTREVFEHDALLPTLEICEPFLKYVMPKLQWNTFLRRSVIICRLMKLSSKNCSAV